MRFSYPRFHINNTFKYQNEVMVRLTISQENVSVNKKRRRKINVVCMSPYNDVGSIVKFNCRSMRIFHRNRRHQWFPVKIFWRGADTKYTIRTVSKLQLIRQTNREHSNVSKVPSSWCQYTLSREFCEHKGRTSVYWHHRTFETFERYAL